ncbi:MAG: type II secretion system F family protein [Kiritimatiellae bacterium]|nr:type II secretion system F family protein [Kiritimatiellia bacterium]
MPAFTYIAFSKSGQRVEGRVEAADRRGAMQAVERLGHVPVSVSEAAAVAPVARGPWWKLTRASDRMRPREVLLFTAELSDLLAAGMTLGNALNCLAGHGDTASARISADLRDRIIQGEALSDAVGAHSRTFPALYRNMLRAGEASGALAEVLGRLVEHYERIMSLRERIIQALTYPAIVMLFGIVTVIVAMVKIVPQFMAVFKNINVALPRSTRLLIGISELLQRYGIFLLVAIVLAGALLHRYIRTPRGRLAYDRLKLKMPLVKGIVANGIFANFARTLQTLLANGVTVLQALKITEETVGNTVIAEEVRHARERVTDGTSISGPLAASKVFPRMMTDMLAIGEQTGDMPGALAHIGRRYENELDRNIKIFTTALEPILIVLVAVVVGFVAISILSAVFKVTSGLGNA